MNWLEEWTKAQAAEFDECPPQLAVAGWAAQYVEGFNTGHRALPSRVIRGGRSLPAAWSVDVLWPHSQLTLLEVRCRPEEVWVVSYFNNSAAIRSRYRYEDPRLFDQLGAAIREVIRGHAVPN